MKFNRLQASISNNANESPSLYVALCAVESLFTDLEDNCGSDISSCPVGNERLPSKLVWLCRIINEIYRDNSDELQRNRNRLDAAIDKLKETQKELEKSAAINDELAKLNSEYAELQQQLQNCGLAAEEYEKLSAKCNQARQTLSQLDSFDFASAQEELKTLTDEIDLKENTKAALLAELEQNRERADTLEQEVDELQAQEQEARNQLFVLQEKQYSIGEEKACLYKEIDELKSERTSFDDELQQLIAERDDTQRSIITLQGKIEEFRDENLAEKHAELEALKKDYEQLEDTIKAFDQDYSQITDRRNQILIDIAHKKDELESLKEKLMLTQQKRDDLEKEKQCLSANLSDCIQNLETLQTQVDELTQNKIPEAKELQAQEQQRRDELLQSVEESENQLTVLREETAKLNEQLPKLEEDVQNNRAVYDALTASCAASSVELENLERQIQELRNNTDEQKLVVYRKQLEEKQQELENVHQECERIQQESSEQENKLEQLQKEKDRLNEMKKRHEDGVAAMEKMLLELKFADDEKYVQEVLKAESRLNLLEKVRNKLISSVNDMQKILGCSPVSETALPEELLKLDLRELRQRTDDLRCALVECANSLKLEER